ncbi:peptide deformylase [Microvirga tunisiensis]|uniref:Peptide deformylase n=1 Tax=Microvirga tunisiensis TaxID=2108360 RepID=A0A5N7N1A8_9HYPH|nr:peptide deformylase [Microvirga tunisiensis]MPR31584.1 peptide deformylase [Microvirga tunisiensis]
MSIRPLVILPDSKLRMTSEPIKEVTGEICRLADDMLETMYHAPGIGLAAIQIGMPVRMVTMDVSKSEDERQPMVLINPEIVWASEEKRVYEEGCLSIPEYYEEVERPDRVRFRYMNLQGETIEQDADGLLATCVQHEIDHLNGVLFIDYLSRLKRDRLRLSFPHHVDHFDPAEDDACSGKRLEAKHGSGPSLDGTVVLLDAIQVVGPE